MVNESKKHKAVKGLYDAWLHPSVDIPPILCKFCGGELKQIWSDVRRNYIPTCLKCGKEQW
jgi:hypothetical protein